MKDKFKKIRQLVIQIVTVIVLFSAAIYGLWRINLIRLPSFVELLITNDMNENSDFASDGYKIFNYISNSDELQINSLYPEINTESLPALLGSLRSYDHYYWDSTSEVHSEQGVRIVNCKSRISGNKYNIEILNERGNTVRKCISDGNKTAITVLTDRGLKTKNYNRGLSDFYFDSSIISIEYLKNLDFAKLDAQVRNINYEGYNLISLAYSYERNDITIKNTFLISLDFGVVLFAECTENGTLTYTLKTNSIYPLTSLNPELFTVS